MRRVRPDNPGKSEKRMGRELLSMLRNKRNSIRASAAGSPKSPDSQLSEYAHEEVPNRRSFSHSPVKKSVQPMLGLPEILADRPKPAARVRRASSVRYSLTSKEEIRHMITGQSSISQPLREVLEQYSEQPDRVQELNLAEKNFGDSDLEALAQLVNVTHNIQSINLSQNQFFFSEGTLHSKALPRKHSKVKKLNLSRNNLGGGKASRLLRGFLQCFANLQELDLSACDLYDVDLHVLVLTFLSLRKLTQLVLSHNNLSDFAMLGVAKVLEDCTDLEVVDISFNSVTPECWRYLRPYKAKVICDVRDSCRCAII